MAQVNHNYAYKFVVDGHTVWERLRVIRNFLSDRRKAYKIAKLSQEKFEAKKDEMDEWERREAIIMNEDQDDLIQDCVDEIAYLEEFEKQLMDLAEQERIPGKTDREMYEINFYKEARFRTVLRAKSEIMSIGHITPETLRNVLRDSEVVRVLVEQGAITPQALTMFKSSNPTPFLEHIGGTTDIEENVLKLAPIETVVEES